MHANHDFHAHAGQVAMPPLDPDEADADEGDSDEEHCKLKCKNALIQPARSFSSQPLLCWSQVQLL